MTSLFVWRLTWWFLTLAAVNVVDGERLKEHSVKAPLCTIEVNPLKNVCYLYDPAPKDQPTALQACENMGGTLAALDTAETSAFVKAGIFHSFTRRGTWIGYNEDFPQWYDGTKFSWANWFPGEPDQSSEKCVIILRDGYLWQDYRCEAHWPSVCQLPALDTQAHAREEKTQGVDASIPRSERSAESKFRCGQYCLQDRFCGKFNFHPTTLKCALYEEGAMVDEADGSQTFAI